MIQFIWAVNEEPKARWHMFFQHQTNSLSAVEMVWMDFDHHRECCACFLSCLCHLLHTKTSVMSMWQIVGLEVGEFLPKPCGHYSSWFAAARIQVAERVEWRRERTMSGHSLIFCQCINTELFITSTCKQTFLLPFLLFNSYLNTGLFAAGQ